MEDDKPNQIEVEQDQVPEENLCTYLKGYGAD